MIGAMIDHLVYASNDLPSASATVAKLVGTAPTPGGRHVGRGTYNELLSLGGATYLEVIGPDPQQADIAGPRPFGIDGLSAPALVAWCVRPKRPLAEIVADARAAGIELGDVTAMSRARPDGVLLEWTLTFPQLDGPLGRALPFMIDWASSAHPTESLASPVHLVQLEVVSPDARRLGAALDIVGVAGAVTISDGPQPALRARLATPNGEVTLSG
jgi:hypothetical protein